MNGEKVQKIARWSSSNEVQKWSSTVGRFAGDAHKDIAALMKTACGECPFRSLVNVGGCITEDCPVHQVMHTVNRAVPRVTNATKEIYKAKYSRKSA